MFVQESWIQHATVKENILFGQSYDATKYASVIAATAMEQVGLCTQGGRADLEIGQLKISVSMGL